MPNSDPSVLFDPLLCFIAANRGSSTAAHIKTVSLARFTPKQVATSKTVLWQSLPVQQCLGKVPDRKGGKKRTVVEADIADLFEAFKKLDDADQLPKFGVLSGDLHFIPRIQAEDIDIVSLAERLLEVEETLKTLVPGRRSQDSELEPHPFVSNQTIEETTPRGAESTSPQTPSLPSQVSPAPIRKRFQSEPNKDTYNQRDLNFSSRWQTTRKKSPRKRLSLPQGDTTECKQPKTPTLQPQSLTAELQRENKNFRSLKAGPGRCKDLFVANIANTTRIDDIHAFVKSKKCKVVSLKKVSREGALAQSFCLTLSAEDFEVLKGPIWPGDIRVRRFLHKSRKHLNGSNDSQPANCNVQQQRPWRRENRVH